MSAVAIVTRGGPKSFTPDNDGVTIFGGLLVEARATGRVGVAAAASVHVVGVALTDAQAPEALVTAPTVDALGRNVLSAAQLPTVVAVAYGDDEVQVTFSANAAFGDLLVCTGAGKVGPAGATPDARTIVGRCTEPLGVVFATNPVGLMRTSV